MHKAYLCDHINPCGVAGHPVQIMQQSANGHWPEMPGQHAMDLMRRIAHT
jgi:hypothetical protein